MYYLIYVSNATRPLSSEQLHDILAVSRESNAQIEVTGLLLYKDGKFMQMLEGAERTVHALLDRITRDPRHYNVLTLQQGTVTTRQFPDWSMGFRHLDEVAGSADGFVDFEMLRLTEAEFIREDPDRSLRLLRMFREHV